jgi:hypothetical protein
MTFHCCFGMTLIKPTYIISDGQSTLGKGDSLYTVLLRSQWTQIMRPSLNITSKQQNSL